MKIYANYANAMRCFNSPRGPIFGKERDLRITDQCDKNNKSFSNLGDSYKLPAGYTYPSDEAQTLLAGSYKFKVDEYEVFYQLP